MSNLNVAPEYALSYHEAERAAELISHFPPSIQMLYRVVMAKVIATLFIVLAAVSGFAFVASLFSRNLSMDRETRGTQQFREKKRNTVVDGNNIN